MSEPREEHSTGHPTEEELRTVLARNGLHKPVSELPAGHLRYLWQVLYMAAHAPGDLHYQYLWDVIDEREQLRNIIDTECPIGALTLAETWRTKEAAYQERIAELEQWIEDHPGAEECTQSPCEMVKALNKLAELEQQLAAANVEIELLKTQISDTAEESVQLANLMQAQIDEKTKALAATEAKLAKAGSAIPILQIQVRQAIDAWDTATELRFAAEAKLQEAEAGAALLRPFVERDLAILQDEYKEIEREIYGDIHHGWRIGREAKEANLAATKKRMEPLQKALADPAGAAFLAKYKVMREALIGAQWIIGKLAPHEAMAIQIRGYRPSDEDMATGARYRALIEEALKEADNHA